MSVGSWIGTVSVGSGSIVSVGSWGRIVGVGSGGIVGVGSGGLALLFLALGSF